ncbi:acyltransferase [Halogeometricum limi]|uniref:Acetyltransferase (Isoleucine patch superfamily) n=1 Tax=Halogeometricum limi TaxID=555875 RepID=A0A1I6IK07_9EURY|nr:acyltransferase [Halogeometricum limi]SFR67043.1 Acetyltransferase (isoleucine patch superfamily) [Halogeometricum limi]
MTSSAIHLFFEKGPFTFATIATSKLASRVRNALLNRRHNISIHRSAEIERDTKFGINGEIVIHEGCTISKSVVVAPSEGRIEIGANSLVNVSTALLGHGDLSIGENALIGPNTTIVAANHGFADRDVPMASQEISAEGITIHDDVWIGSNCAILDGVTLGEGAVVAAGSVVTESVAPYTIVGGVPAKEIRTR